MKHITTIASVLLGIAFIVFGANFFLHFIPMPNDAAPASAPHKLFMAALAPTGYLAMVKIFEIIGGVLLLVPAARNIGLLIIGPIIVNIIAYHAFLTDRSGLFAPPHVVIYLLGAYLLFAGRKAFAGLLK
jgi:putative oxidoreductase